MAPLIPCWFSLVIFILDSNQTYLCSVSYRHHDRAACSKSGFLCVGHWSVYPLPQSAESPSSDCWVMSSVRALCGDVGDVGTGWAGAEHPPPLENTAVYKMCVREDWGVNSAAMATGSPRSRSRWAARSACEAGGIFRKRVRWTSCRGHGALWELSPSHSHRMEEEYQSVHMGRDGGGG